MKNTNSYGNGYGYEFDIFELIFLVFSGLFILFYFTDSNFKYFVNSFYLFIGYSFKNYPAVVILYAVNLFMFFAGLHSLYVRIFEIRLTGSKLKMHDKLEKQKENDVNGVTGVK